MATKKAAVPAKKTAKAVAEETPVKKTRAKAAPAEAPAKKPRAKKVEAVEDDEPKTKKKSGFDPYAFMGVTVDEISKRQGMDTDVMDMVQPMSTGSLALDIQFGGGLKPAMYTNAGFEQGGKTTSMLAMMGAAILAGVPLISLIDFEGSTQNSMDYVAYVLRTMGVKLNKDQVFGKKDDEGRWLIPPRVRYSAETRGEKFFDWLSSLLRELPDKRYVAKGWWLVYDENNKKHKAAVGDHADKNMARKYGKGLWVPAPDGGLQAAIFSDSYPAMNPEANDEEEANNSLGLHARFFAKHLPRIKGRLAQKMVALVGVNQLREIPMAMYGPKEKEACGQALRFNSDCRNWFNSRSSGMPFNAKFDQEEKVEIERSVQGKGRDRYRYVQVVNKKNKLAQPGRKTWLRIWVSNFRGEGSGFDPMFDTMQYLRDTGQLVSKNRQKMLLKIDGKGDAKKATDWMTLKKWVLGTKDEMKEVCAELGFDKPFDLRKYCFMQVASKRGEQLYVAQGNGGSEENLADDENEEDNDD